MMTPAQEILNNISLKDIPSILGKLTESEQHQLLFELEKLAELKDKELAQDKFLAFVVKVWPSFIAGRHHAKMAAAFEEVANGTCKRLIINMPPRHTKSEFASYLLPAWFLGKFPGKKIIDALVDLPFALPTAVAGIALTAVYSNNGWIGSWLEPHGIKVAFTPLGVVVAAVFVAGILVGADSMSRAVNVPTYIADVIVSVSLLSMLVATMLAQVRVIFRRKAHAG